MRGWIVVCAQALAAFVVVSCTEKRKVGPTSSSDGSTDLPASVWHQFAPEGARFHAEFPGVPTTADGNAIGHPTHDASVKERDRIYFLSYMETPAGNPTALTFAEFAAVAPDRATKSFSSRLGVACTHDAPRTTDIVGRRAVEFTIHCGPTASSRTRLVDGGDRVFQLIVSGSPEVVSDSVADRFFNSLTVDR